jgi:hypothetical protein
MTQLNCECNVDPYGNVTLADIRQDVLIGLGYAAQLNNPPPGMEELTNYWIKSSQKFLYRKYRALHTKRYYQWPMVVGQRFYGLTSSRSTACMISLDPARIAGVWCEDSNGSFTPLRAGIPATFYTGVANTGIPCRYAIRQCIEVFPAPAGEYTLWMLAHALARFEQNTDISTIDSELVTLWALAKGKSHYGQPDAGEIAGQAHEYLRDLVSGTHTTKTYVPGVIELPPETMPVFLPLEN